MGIEDQSNYLKSYAKYQFRKIKFLPLLLAIFVTFLFAIPYFTKDYIISYNNELPINDLLPDNSDNSKQDSKCTHHKIMLLITTEMENIERRMLMREMLFGITDNLVPCMKQDTTDIHYKFLAQKKSLDGERTRKFKSEQMEYNDVSEIVSHKNDDWQKSLLKYSLLLQRVQGTCVTFDHLVLMDEYTMINLEKIQNKISSSIIGKQKISDTQKVIWGSFHSNITDNMAVIIGSKAIQPILDAPNYKSKNYTSVISRFYHHHYNHPNIKIPDDLILINDPLSIVEWPNSIKSIVCVDCVVAIGHIYQDWEVRKIKNELEISTLLPCKVRTDLEVYTKGTSKLRPSVAVITSSFLYHDNCMLEAAPISAQNKREYAERHGYAFVSRSSEFAQQIFRKRNNVWGKIDALEKVLPYYEWLIWLDMDAIFVNRSLSVEQLLEMCEERVGGKEEFDKINFIVARPVGDDMINAGVFLIRNSEWARDFIRTGIQARRDRAYRGMKEQQAMRDAIKQQNWKPNILYLNGDDHTINTFPDRYVRGDYIVHYAPEEGCPAHPVLDGITKVKILEAYPDSDIGMPF